MSTERAVPVLLVSDSPGCASDVFGGLQKALVALGFRTAYVVPLRGRVSAALICDPLAARPAVR